MSEDEKRRSIVLRRVASEALTLEQGARILRVSYRQMKRIWKRWQEEGDSGLAHRSRGKPSNRSFSNDFKKQILEKYSEYGGGLGPTEFAVRLGEEGIQLDHETLRRWLLKANLWTLSPATQSTRQLKPSNKGFGELLTLVSIHDDWLGSGRGNSYLLCLRDEAMATTELLVASDDSRIAPMRILWSWIDLYGIPEAIRCQRPFLSMKNWRPTLEEQLAGAEPVTPFCCSCQRLGVDVGPLSSAEARGVLQDLSEFTTSVHEIFSQSPPRTVREANLLLRERLPHSPVSIGNPGGVVADHHVRIIDGTDLRKVFCLRRERSVDRELTLEHNNRRFRIVGGIDRLRQKLRKVTVSEWLDGSLHIVHGCEELSYVEITSQHCSSTNVAM